MFPATPVESAFEGGIISPSGCSRFFGSSALSLILGAFEKLALERLMENGRIGGYFQRKGVFCQRPPRFHGAGWIDGDVAGVTRRHVTIIRPTGMGSADDGSSVCDPQHFGLAPFLRG